MLGERGDCGEFPAANAGVRIKGFAQITADLALNAGADSTFNIVGSESRGNLLLKGNVANSGTVNLKNADLTVSDTTEKGMLGTVNTVGSQESSVVLGGGEYKIAFFSGENKSLVLTDLGNTESVTIMQKMGDLGITATGSFNDQFVNADEAAKALNDAVVILQSDEANAVNTIEVMAGRVS